MNKILIAVAISMLCFSGAQETCCGLTSNLDVVARDSETDSEAINAQINSFKDYIKVLSPYFSKVKLCRKKQPISKDKLPQETVNAVHPLTKFMQSMLKGKATKEQWREVKATLNSNTITIIKDGLAKIAIQKAIYVIENDLDALPNTQHELASKVCEDLKNFREELNKQKRILSRSKR